MGAAATQKPLWEPQPPGLGGIIPFQLISANPLAEHRAKKETLIKYTFSPGASVTSMFSCIKLRNPTSIQVDPPQAPSPVPSLPPSGLGDGSSSFILLYFGCTNDRFGGCSGVLRVHEGDEMNGGGGYEVVGGIYSSSAVVKLREFYVQENGRAPVATNKKGRELKTDNLPVDVDIL